MIENQHNTEEARKPAAEQPLGDPRPTDRTPLGRWYGLGEHLSCAPANRRSAATRWPSSTAPTTKWASWPDSGRTRRCAPGDDDDWWWYVEPPRADPSRIHPEDLTALADLLVERIQLRRAVPDGPVLEDAAATARLFGVTAAWVRQHAAELGGVRLGDGPRGRWRFDPERVAAALSAREPAPGPSSHTRSVRPLARVPARSVSPRPIPGDEA